MRVISNSTIFIIFTLHLAFQYHLTPHIFHDHVLIDLKYIFIDTSNIYLHTLNDRNFGFISDLGFRQEQDTGVFAAFYNGIY